MTAPKVSGWLLLAASLPGRQSGTARVRLWRALKDAGAASLRDGVTLVPALPAIRERLAAIAKDIEAEGGTAWIFHLEGQSPTVEKKLKRLFDRSEIYHALAPAIAGLRREIATYDEAEARRRFRDIEQDLRAVLEIDFFPGTARAHSRGSLDKLRATIDARFSPQEPSRAAGNVPRRKRRDFHGALWATRAPGAIVVGSKNFTEQLILGEIVAQTIERETGLKVERRLNLGGTLICDRALLSGDIDVYVEYTGTALTAIFHQQPSNDPRAVTEKVRELYAGTGRTLLAPLGYDNTFAILVRGADARARGLRTIDDAAKVTPEWKAGFGYEFLERPDGYKGLAKTYGLTFRAPPQVMDLTLSYRALASGQVDLIAGDATAGLIKALDLFQLADNRRYFPPYDAVPVAHASTLLRYPQVRRALERLAGRITAADMREMNNAADARRENPADIARSFLDRRQ